MFMGWKPALGGANAKNYDGPSGAWDGAELAPQAHDGVDAGLAIGTIVATQFGWRRVETLREGDKVMTFDGGLQEVTTLKRGHLWQSGTTCPPVMWPLLVPEGALGNAQPLTLMPDQNVLLESDTAEDIYGDPFVLVPANALEGALGIERVMPNGPLEAITLGFENDEIIYVNGSALVFCPARAPGAPLPLNELPGLDMLAEYAVLSPMEAKLIVSELKANAPHGMMA